MSDAPSPPRVALVTGSTSGIGAAIARRLARDGFTVALHGRRPAAVVETLARDLGAASYHAADLADEAAPAALLGAVLARHGRLDVLVNNAGESVRIPHGDLQAATAAVWRRMLDVNLVAPFRLVAEAAPALRRAAVLARHGRLDVLVNNAGESLRIAHADLKAATAAVWRRMLDVNLVAPFRLVAEAAPALRRAAAASGRAASVVNIGTHAGVRPKGASIPYAAAKAGLHHVTRLLALTLGPEIRVNAVAPGLVETPMTADWTDAMDLWQGRSPMRRPAKPDDIADLVAALVANDYVTGEIVLADGGLNLT